MILLPGKVIADAVESFTDALDNLADTVDNIADDLGNNFPARKIELSPDVIIGKTTSTKFQNEMYKNHTALKRYLYCV